MIKDIAFVGYPVTDIARARKFYEGVLGLTPNNDFPAKEDATWIEYNVGPNSAIAIIKSDEWMPSRDGAAVALEVDDFEGTIAKLKDAGCEFLWDAQDFPTCQSAVVRDPDGSPICIHKRKK